MEGMMEFAKSDLDTLKEIASKEIARDRNCADCYFHTETSKLGMVEIESMNSRGNGEPCGNAQPHFSARHQIDFEGRYNERPIKDRELRSAVNISLDVYRWIVFLM